MAMTPTTLAQRQFVVARLGIGLGCFARSRSMQVPFGQRRFSAVIAALVLAVVVPAFSAAPVSANPQYRPLHRHDVEP